VAAPASVHADLDRVILQHLGKRVAGELHALIRIEVPGSPNRARASLGTSTQNLAASVFDSRQDSTHRDEV
jgi:hypothetical protein